MTRSRWKSTRSCRNGSRGTRGEARRPRCADAGMCRPHRARAGAGTAEQVPAATPPDQIIASVQEFIEAVRRRVEQNSSDSEPKHAYQ